MDDDALSAAGEDIRTLKHTFGFEAFEGARWVRAWASAQPPQPRPSDARSLGSWTRTSLPPRRRITCTGYLRANQSLFGLSTSFAHSRTDAFPTTLKNCLTTWK